MPLVIRGPVGGGNRGGPFHSQNVEMAFFHTPGLKIVYPSTAKDAKGLLKASIRDDNPVIFEEHKGLYRAPALREVLPDEDYIVPLGEARTVREGTDLTIVTYGAMVQRALQAANELADHGFSAEVIDLRSLNPVDWDTVISSVQNTGKCLVVQEDCRFVGYGAEIAAEVGERCFQYLDGPVRRLAGKDTPVPFNWDLEEEILPQMKDVTKAMMDLAQF